MSKQVEELVEWVAKEIGQHTENCPWEICSGSEQDAARRSARFILSHPDLALMKEGMEEILPVRFLHPDDKPNTSYELARQDMLKWHRKSIIPLREALKEVKE